MGDTILYLLAIGVAVFVGVVSLVKEPVRPQADHPCYPFVCMQSSTTGAT